MITKKQIRETVKEYLKGFTGDLLVDEYIDGEASYSIYAVPEWMSVDDYLYPNEAEMIELVQDYFHPYDEMMYDEALEYINNDFSKSDFTLRLFWEYDGSTIEHLVPENSDTTLKDIVDFIMDDYNEYQVRIEDDDFWEY